MISYQPYQGGGVCLILLEHPICERKYIFTSLFGMKKDNRDEENIVNIISENLSWQVGLLHDRVIIAWQLAVHQSVVARGVVGQVGGGQ